MSKGNLWVFSVGTRTVSICAFCHHALCANAHTAHPATISRFTIEGIGSSIGPLILFVRTHWLQETSSPGGVFYLECSLTKTVWLEEEDPSRSTWYNFWVFSWGICQIESPPRGEKVPGSDLGRLPLPSPWGLLELHGQGRSAVG